MLRLLIVALLMCVASGASAKEKDEFRYEIVSAGVGTEGNALIKVYSYARNKNKAIELGKKNAVHGILFKGVPGGSGSYTQPPLVKPDQQAAHADFFKSFFKNGEYLRYVKVSSDGIISPKDMMQVGKEFKIGIVFVVSKSELRKYLESNGIIKSLGSMF